MARGAGINSHEKTQNTQKRAIFASLCGYAAQCPYPLPLSRWGCLATTPNPSRAGGGALAPPPTGGGWEGALGEWGQMPAAHAAS